MKTFKEFLNESDSNPFKAGDKVKYHGLHYTVKHTRGNMITAVSGANTPDVDVLTKHHSEFKKA